MKALDQPPFYAPILNRKAVAGSAVVYVMERALNVGYPAVRLRQCEFTSAYQGTTPRGRDEIALRLRLARRQLRATMAASQP